jgi:DNA repair exonuclease SbcCD ATPase subunit
MRTKNRLRFVRSKLFQQKSQMSLMEDKTELDSTPVTTTATQESAIPPHLQEDFKVFVLTVLVRGAKDLRANDVGGTSDPFCSITVGEQSKSSEILKKTLQPQWNQSFSFFLEKAQTIRFAVYDWSVLKNELLGEAEFETEELFDKLSSFEGWISLGKSRREPMSPSQLTKSPRASKKSRGEINIQVTCRKLAPSAILEAEVMKLTHRISQLETENMELEQKLQTATVIANSATSDAAAAMAARKQSMEAITNSSSEVVRWQEEAHRMLQEIEDLKDKRTKLKENEKKLMAKVEELTKQQEESKSQIEGLQLEISNLLGQSETTGTHLDGRPLISRQIPYCVFCGISCTIS